MARFNVSQCEKPVRFWGSGFLYGFGICAGLNFIFVMALYEPRIEYSVEYQLVSDQRDDVGIKPLTQKDIERMI